MVVSAMRRLDRPGVREGRHGLRVGAILGVNVGDHHPGPARQIANDCLRICSPPCPYLVRVRSRILERVRPWQWFLGAGLQQEYVPALGRIGERRIEQRRGNPFVVVAFLRDFSYSS
jgi:hypothetical protein